MMRFLRLLRGAGRRLGLGRGRVKTHRWKTGPNETEMLSHRGPCDERCRGPWMMQALKDFGASSAPPASPGTASQPSPSSPASQAETQEP